MFSVVWRITSEGPPEQKQVGQQSQVLLGFSEENWALECAEVFQRCGSCQVKPTLSPLGSGKIMIRARQPRRAGGGKEKTAQAHWRLER